MGQSAWSRIKRGFAIGLGHEASLFRENLKAAKNGDPPAQYDVGVAYANGFGVTADDNEAMRWFLAAAEQGVPAAETAL